MTCTVTLTRDQVALVDDEDYDAVMAAGPWIAFWPGGRTLTFYGQRVYRDEHGHRRHQYLHTFLTGFKLTDHRDGDGLNNQRSNLREATVSQNQRNARGARNSSSQYKGVGWQSQIGRWRAYIWLDGKSKHLGTFTDEVEAAKAYDAAAREHFGEFARLNLGG